MPGDTNTGEPKQINQKCKTLEEARESVTQLNRELRWPYLEVTSGEMEFYKGLFREFILMIGLSSTMFSRDLQHSTLNKCT